MTSYTASVPNSVTSEVVTPTLSDPTATITSITGTSGFVVGPNTIQVTVTAQDGITQKVYSIVVTRQASSNADLSGLALSAGTLSPAFSSGVLAYSATVANSVASLTVTPALSDSTATVTSITGTSGFVVGPNTIQVTVTAQDGVTQKVYSVAVTREFGGNADLSALALSSGTLAPAFDPAVTSYTANVENSVSSIAVMPMLSDTNARISSVTGTGALSLGVNPVAITVTAQDNVTVKTYTVLVRRATLDAQYAFANFAGLPGVSGSASGTGTAARFNSPMGVALDIARNVYVADYGNNLVRKITPAGAVTTMAGGAGVSGTANGVGGAARFNGPGGLAVDAAGSVYVADGGNNTIRKITATGVVSTLAGSPGVTGSANATGAAARFRAPGAIATGTGGMLYVADSGNHTIRRVTSAGVVTTIAGSPGLSGAVDATGSAARFNNPVAIASDPAGNLYVADWGNYTIRKLTLTGSLWSVSTLAGTAGAFGTSDGLGAAARFTYPAALAVDATGTVFVADCGNHTIRKVTPAGLVTTIGGSAGAAGSADGIGSAAGFNNPFGLAVDAFGNLYIGDYNNQRISKGTPLQASGYGSTDATGIAVSGSANPYGLDSMAWFEYGPTNTYGSQTAPQSIGNGAEPVSVTDTLPVASASNTIVHFRLVVYNEGGYYYGADCINGPGYIVNAAAVTGTSVTLSASVNPGGFAGPATDRANVKVFWQYGLVSGSYGLTSGTQSIGTGTAMVPVTFTRAKAGLSTAVYRYRLAISCSQGTIYSPDQVFSFVAPTTVVNSPSVTLAGAVAQATVNPNGVATSVSIQYGLTTAYGSGTTATQSIGSGLAPVTVTGTFAGLTPNTLYHYRVVTVNSLGTVYGPDQVLATQALYGTAAVAWSKGATPGIAGATFSVLGNPVVNDADHTAFQATVIGAVGSGVTTSNNSGIWADSGTSGRTLIVRTGQLAPGYANSGLITGTFATLGDPVYANDDTIAFIGTLVKTGTTLSDIRSVNNTGVWTTISGSLTLVARTGDPAPDAAGTVSGTAPLFASFAQIALPNQGGVVILGNLVAGTVAAPGPGGVVATNSQGIWIQDATGVLKQAIRKGDRLTVSGTTKTVSVLTIFNAPVNATGQARHFNNAGDLLFKVSFTDGSSAIVKALAGLTSPISAVVTTKSPAAAITGGTFSVLGNPIVNDTGDFAFQATLSTNVGAGIGAANNSGIWVDSGTAGRMLVARTGQLAPGYPGSGLTTGTFATVTDPVFANDNAVAFLGTLVKTGTTALDIRSTNNTGIWTTISGSLTLVARTGDPAPDADGNVSASSPVFASFAQYVLPNQGGVVIIGNLVVGTAAAPAPGGVVAANSQGIWAQDANGVLKQIIRKGDGLTVNGKAKAVLVLSLLNAPASATGQTRHFNDAGDLLYKANFTDGTIGIMQSVFP